MNEQKFVDDLSSPRLKKIVEITSKTDSWFDYNDLVSMLLNEHTSHQSPSKRAQRSRRAVTYFIRLGVLLADPEKGVKFNKDFIPLNQK